MTLRGLHFFVFALTCTREHQTLRSWHPSSEATTFGTSPGVALPHFGAAGGQLRKGLSWLSAPPFGRSSFGPRVSARLAGLGRWSLELPDLRRLCFRSAVGGGSGSALTSSGEFGGRRRVLVELTVPAE